jgi:hypothetical protein
MHVLKLDPDRAEHLVNRIASSNAGKEFVPAWPRSDKELPAVEVETRWVRFSTLNHRTRAEQDRVIKISGRDDLFSADPLGEEAQSEQYKILCEQEGFASLKEDVRTRGQQEPAIITADGILINGNRRAAALRSLLDDNYLDARYIRCLVLPADATAAEIVDLEAELQIARTFKQDYSWVNEALLIQELYDREGKNLENVARRMHRKPSEVRDMYEKIQQVQQLVAISQGTRHLVDFSIHESAFDELAKHIRNKSPKEKKDVRSVYFLGTLSGAEYRTLRHLRRPDAAELVRHEIEKDPAMKQILSLADAPSANDSDGDLLDDVLGKSDPEGGLNDLLGFVAARRKEASVEIPGGDKIAVTDMLNSIKSAVSAAAQEAAEQEKDEGALSAPLERVEKAIDELHRAYARLPKARAFPEWSEANLSEKITRLERVLAKLKAAP